MTQNIFVIHIFTTFVEEMVRWRFCGLMALSSDEKAKQAKPCKQQNYLPNNKTTKQQNNNK